ncbi:MAG TPA: hypothetical protein VMU94_08480 [Streptosporangiaceae bacterium]|nr:hypothetical protein [Streptosporangiaceae bacterium]
MAAASFEHGGEARAALRAIVSDPAYGADALSSPRIMASLLSDLLPDAPRESGLLLAAAEKNLPAVLREHVMQGLDVRTAVSLAASSLASSTAFAPEVCEWVAGELAIALGLATQAQPASQERPSPRAQVAGAPGAADPQETTPRPPTEPPTHGAGPARPNSSPDRDGSASRAGKPPGRFSPGLILVLGLAGVLVAAATGYGLVALAGSASPSPSSPAAATPSSRPSSLTAPAGGLDYAWIAQLASVPVSAGRTRLATVLARVRLEVPGAQVLTSSDYASLTPGYWVVYYAGGFTIGTQALDYCAARGRTSRVQCIGRYLSHDAADIRYQCYPPATSPAATCFHAAPAPSDVVQSYLAAISQRDWPTVWQLGGKNLGQTYAQMIAGYRQTSKIVITRLTASGDAVSVRVLAYETTGAVQTYALSYLVSGGAITTGQSTLIGTGG